MHAIQMKAYCFFKKSTPGICIIIRIEKMKYLLTYSKNTEYIFAKICINCLMQYTSLNMGKRWFQ